MKATAISEAPRGRNGNVRVKSGSPVLFKVLFGPDVFPVSISHGRSSVTAPTQLNYHAEIELHFIKQGNSRYLIDGKLYAFQSNSMLIIQPRRVHRLLHQPGVWIERWSLIFNLKLLQGRATLNFARKLPTLIPLSAAEMNELEFRLRMMAGEKREKREKRENQGEEALKRSFIINELDQLVIRLKQAGKETDVKPYNHPQIRKVLDFIDIHFKEPLAVSLLAELAALSPSHFSHLFKHYTRMGVKQYILHRRMAEAKTLLEGDPGQKLAPLAEHLGFSDLSLFNRCFRRFTGMTPSGFRTISQKDSRKC